MLTDILADLPELVGQDGATAVDPYKLAVVSGFVFKFYNHVYSAMVCYLFDITRHKYKFKITAKCKISYKQ